MPRFFPDPEDASSEGLLAIGGNLSAPRLLEAYTRGIFPYYDDSTPILWWSPDPRAILPLDAMHVSRRLARTVRSGRFTFSINQAFVAVLEGCGDRTEGTWLTEEMLTAYTHLHALGYAHSLEVWHEGELAGGVYGVAIGGLFSGESMFSRVRDASKVALVHLVAHLNARGFVLFDVQYANDHTSSLGAVEIPRRDYLRRLRQAVVLPVSFVGMEEGE